MAEAPKVVRVMKAQRSSNGAWDHKPILPNIDTYLTDDKTGGASLTPTDERTRKQEQQKLLNKTNISDPKKNKFPKGKPQNLKPGQISAGTAYKVSTSHKLSSPYKKQREKRNLNKESSGGSV